MKTKLLVIIVLVLFVTIGWGRSSFNNDTLAKQNQQIKNTLLKEDNISKQLFKVLPDSYKIDVKSDIRNAVFLKLDFTELAWINKNKSSLLTLNIPSSGNSEVTFDLRSVRILTDNFTIITGKNEKVNYTPGTYYQGTVSGITPSLAAWSMFDNSVMAVFSYSNENYVLGLWNDKSNINNDIYILYKDRDVLYNREFNCGIDEVPEKLAGSGNQNPGQLLSNQCIKIYFECDYQMFLDKGSVVNVGNYVTGMFNVVQALYTVEVINTEISQIFVWDTADPYIPYTTSNDLLTNFQLIRTVFNGNLAHFLTTRNLGAGGVAYLDVICTPSSAYGISNIDNTYAAYPNYCWTTEVVTHELGHNFGSHHTHWCGWVGGPIDNCVAVDAGPCTPGPTPTNGGTIMSYCHLSSVGILLTNGFGQQPGDAIRASYNAASCLTACASPPLADFTATPSGCSTPISVTFTDNTVGFTSSWNWDIDNNGTTDYTIQSPTHSYLTAGTYTIRLIASNANGSDTMIKTITIGYVVPSVSTAITFGSDSICAGGNVVIFTATPTNGGTAPLYQWYKNAVAIPAATNATFSSATLANNDIITCKITSDETCPSPTTATSTGITMTVFPVVIPSVTIAISSGSGTICAGTSVTFSATGVNGGSSPIYQWQVNGISVGTNSTTYTSSTWTNNDLVTCIITSNANCASPLTSTSNIISMAVNLILSPTVSIIITSGSNPTCAGTPITFYAFVTTGGTSPTYQWKKNGVNTVTTISYTPALPANGDVITCSITSNASCLGTNAATSSPVTVSIISLPSPSVSIAVTSGTNPSCTGDMVTFTSTPTNAGTSPVYQWLLNGNLVAGAQSQTFTPLSLSDGNVISCMVTSDVACPETTTSTGITATVYPISTINFIYNLDVCGGNIAATVFISNPAGADYTWTNSNTAIGLVAGGTGNVPSFNANNTTGNPIIATITVIPSINNCPGITSTYTVTVNPTPVITQTGTTLTSSSASTYQWYLNGQPVQGATNQSYTATQNGDYMVIVDGGTCPSAESTVSTSGIVKINNEYFFTVYPNPNDGTFFVSFDIPEKNTYTLKIENIVGALIYQEILNDFEGKFTKQMNFEGFGKGVYLITLTSIGSKIAKKVMIY